MYATYRTRAHGCSTRRPDSELGLAELQTRWKDRDGEPTLVEASHLRRTERIEAEATAEDGEGESADA